MGESAGAVVPFAYTRFVNENIDYSDIRMWRNNPELILRKAKNYAYRWGSAYDDKEDLQMVIAEAILKMIDKFDPSYGTTINGQIYMAAKRAVLDYGRKYGKFFKGRNPETRIDIRESEYHEIDLDDMGEVRGIGKVIEARMKASTSDRHENFHLIQELKKENDLTRKIIFSIYFLDIPARELAEELGCSEGWIHEKVQKFKDKYYKENYLNGNSRSSFSCLEDLPMEKLEDFYELVQKQSSLTQKVSTES